MEYRVSISRKPTVRLYTVEDGDRRHMAEVTGWRADLVKEVLLRRLNSRTVIKFRDGRKVLSLDESSALRLFLAMKAITPLRGKEKAKSLLKSIRTIDDGEVLWWFTLYSRLGAKAASALRVAYSE